MIQPRGTLTTRRMTAHWGVLAAAALTTLVAAAVGAALAVFAGQALPIAVRHDLSTASGTALSVEGPVTNSQATATADALRTAIGQALHGVPFGFWAATWSDPLDLVPGSLPARPSSAGKGNTPLLEAASVDGVTSHAVLVSGQWPAAVASSQPTPAGTSSAGEPRSPELLHTIPAALPATTAALLRLSPGDVLTLRDGDTNIRVAFRITGLFAPRKLSGAAASYWTLNTIPASGASIQSGFIVYGPLLVSPAAFTPAAGLGSAGSGSAGSGSAGDTPLASDTGTWLAQPDMTRFTDTDLPAISGDVSAFQSSMLNSSLLGGMQVSTGLPSVLGAAASDLTVARSLLVISALQLLLLAFAALFASARLLVTQREGETVLLTARGATRWQLTWLTGCEVVPLGAAAAVGGGLIGIRLAALLAATGTLRDAGIRLPGPSLLVGGPAGGIAGSAAGSMTGAAGSAAGTWLDAAAAAAVVAVIAIAAMLIPGLTAQSADAQGVRARHGRQAVIAGATRAGADLALIVLAVLAGWQLRRFSAGASAGSTVDPVLALAPALALAGGTVVTLRLLPAAARAAEGLASRGRRLTASLAGWQVSRQPLRQGGAVMLLVMAVATGTLAIAQHASWERSASDQASMAAGADARVDTPAPLDAAAERAITHAADVTGAMAASVQQGAQPAEVLAIDAAHAPAIVRLRRDQSRVPVTGLFGAITPKQSSVTAASARSVPIPAIATQSFLDATNVTVGSVVKTYLNTDPVLMSIVAVVASFPTVTGGGGALVVDLPTVQRTLAAEGAAPLPVTEWWLATADHQVPPRLASVLPPGSAITGTAPVLAALTGDPLSAAPQQALLALAVAAVLLAITGFWVSIAADSRQRRAEHALLAALGVARGAAAVRLVLEKVLISVPSAALGALLGELVARLLVPAITLTAAARQPVPPPVTLFGLPEVITLAAVVAVLPAVAAALVMARRPDPAAELRAAEAA